MRKSGYLEQRMIDFIGTWRSPVAHLLGVQGVAGSNPAVPTRRSRVSRRDHFVTNPAVPTTSHGMKYSVYILRSLKDGIHYVGQTGDLTRRLKEHNQGRVRWTKQHVPWRVIYREEFDSRSEAIRREHFLKSPKGWLQYSKLKVDGRGFPEGITS